MTGKLDLTNVVIDRKAFLGLLNTFDEEIGDKQSEWSSACWPRKPGQKPLPRISEVKRMVMNPERTYKNLDRALSYSKFVNMAKGLIRLNGSDTVKKKIIQSIMQEPDENKRMLLIAAYLEDKDTKKKAFSFLMKCFKEELKLK
ncbi:MAG: hypothetical protein H7831_14195 [Magnetococcus sp. WYHC-3]